MEKKFFKVLDGVDDCPKCEILEENVSVYDLYLMALLYIRRRRNREQSAKKMGVVLPGFLSDYANFKESSLSFCGFFELLNSESGFLAGDVCPIFDFDGKFILFDLKQNICVELLPANEMPEQEGLAVKSM